MFFLARWLKPKRAADFARIIANLNRIMSQLDTLETRLNAITATLGKAAGEIVTELTALREAITGIDLPPAALTALENLEAQAKALDDIIPDAPPVDENPPVDDTPPDEQPETDGTAPA